MARTAPVDEPGNMTELVPHLAISAATVTGLLTVIWLLWSKRDATLSHTRRLLVVVVVFYAARSLDWVLPAGLFRTLTIMAASFIPLMMLLVIEGLMRQHAPRWIKILAAGGGCLLPLVFLAVSLTRNPDFPYLLFVFQFLAFASFLYLIVKRDKTLLSNTENSTMTRIGLVLVILLPLLASDYKLLPHPIPVMMSGVSVLIGCWVLLQLHVRQLGSLKVIFELTLLAVFSLAATSFVTWHLGLDATATLQVWSMLFAFTVAAAIFVNALKLRWQSGPMGSVTQGLTQAETFESYLNDLKQRELGCFILSDRELADFDQEKLIAAFHTDGAAEITELPGNSSKDTMSQSQMRTLLNRYGGVQAYLVASNPLHIAIAQGSGITQGPNTDLLQAFSLARLFADRDALRSMK